MMIARTNKNVAHVIYIHFFLVKNVIYIHAAKSVLKLIYKTLHTSKEF